MATKCEQEHARQQECDHYWVIESAEGPLSKGVCRLCGGHKEFNNYLLDCLGENSKEYRELLRSQGDDKEVKESEGDTLARVSRLYYATILPSQKGFPKGKRYLFSKA